MTYDEAHKALWDRQAKPAAGSAHAWVQWKGTDACMDLHCPCGTHSHLDAMFAYYVSCPVCGAVYFVNGHVELARLTGEEERALTAGGVDAKRGDLS